MTHRIHSLIAIAIAATAACGAVQAAEVSALTNPTSYTFGASNYFGSAAQTVAPGITWTSAYGSSVYGYTGGYYFNTNSYWNGLSMIGTNSASAAMKISFASAVSGVGMFMNYAPGFNSPAVFNAYDSNNNLLDSYTLNFSVNSANGGQFVGFQDASADISYVTMAGSYIGGTNLQVSTASAVPEASNLALMAAGLGLMGLVARRRKQA